MDIRLPFAEQFYAGDILEQISAFERDISIPGDLSPVKAGVVPHAGWVYSGKTAAYVFTAIQSISQPETMVLFGTVHNTGFVKRSSIYSKGAWSTPVGEVEVDNKLAGEILESMPELIVDNPHGHDGEHSIEVQVPFIKTLFPNTKIVPIAIMPDSQAVDIGKAIADLVQKNAEKEICVVGTTDLTHYGLNYDFMPAGSGNDALNWMHDNDKAIIDLALELKADSIIKEAQNNHNACGPGALAASIAYAEKMGARRGRLLEYTTSYEVRPENDFSMGVGYAGIIF